MLASEFCTHCSNSVNFADGLHLQLQLHSNPQYEFVQFYGNSILFFFVYCLFKCDRTRVFAGISVQSRLAETRFAETPTLTLTLNPSFGETGFGESGRHQPLTLISAKRVSVKREDTGISKKPTLQLIHSLHCNS